MDDDEFDSVVLWGPDGAARIVVPEEDLPHAVKVDRSKVAGWPDVEAEGDVNTMVALRVPPKVGGRYGRDAEELVDLEPLQDRHITVVHLGRQPQQERDRLHRCVREWIAESEWPPMEGEAQGWGTFTPTEDGKRNVLWMGWNIPGLAEMRHDLANRLRDEGFEWEENFDYVPHETVGYTQEPLGSLPGYPDQPVRHSFDGLTIGEGNDDWTEYPFQSGLVMASGRPAVVAALEAAVDDELAAMTDSQLEALIAAGGADRNRGNAEKLRRYWTVGKGGAKIRWNTKGDWERCVKHLRKHLGPRAKGYCALRHKEMTGLHTGDMKHRIMYGWGGKPGSYWARVAAKGENSIAASGEEAPTIMGPDGGPVAMLVAGPKQRRRFVIPMLLPEGIESGDGRTFEPGVVQIRDFPIPLLWQPNSMQGHDGAMIVGRIDGAERVEGGIGNAHGVFDTSPIALEAVRMIEDGFLRGVSADLDKFEAKIIGKGAGTATAGEDSKDDEKDEKDDVVAPDKMSINQGRIMAATLVAKPAFESVRIELADDESEDAVEEVLVPAGGAVAADAGLPDGVYRGRIEGALRADAARFAQREVRRIKFSTEMAQFSSRTGLTAAAAPVAPTAPPIEWFDNPRLGKPTHLTITDDGRVFGHIAAWNVDHIGMGFGTRPPKSKTNYAYFRTGLLRTEEGVDVRVGQITLSGGHASLSADAQQAVKHYDDTNSAFADVVAGEDRHGIWVAGALRPEVTEGQLRAARASSPSGDWRPINGKLELVAVCQVNVPGFPVVEAMVAGGHVLALVAAGTAPLIADLVSAPQSEAEVIDPGEFADAGVPDDQAEEDAETPAEQEAEGAEGEEEEAETPAEQEAEGAQGEEDEQKPEFAARRPSVREMAVALANERLEAQALSVRERMAGMLADTLVAGGSIEAPEPKGLTIRDAAVLLFAMREEQAREAMTAAARHALPDGTWRIADEAGLKTAVEEFGSCAKEDRDRVKRHIVRRAASLGADGLLPVWWREDAAEFSTAVPEAEAAPLA